ncbi:pyridoxamine 5'-phosphate oxidase family protein [Bacillus sp. DJP31]|uniref:pyridoxamine 5'-phosphate oxidase family protein n=1 Tax=Bacillus sp. DJP31 TaxID=3409789 RepID=UPI003BB6D244
MDEKLKQKVVELMDGNKVGTLATIRENKPFTRFMNFNHDEVTLYTATNKHTHKVEDISQNPSVHILLGNEGGSWHESYLEIEAVAEITDDAAWKEKCWDEHLHKWLEGPQDPNYVVLKLTPKSIRVFSEAGKDPEELSL